MHIVDSHCHASAVWFEPVEVLLFQMDQNSVDQAVLTQLLGQFDNSYQQRCMERYPGRFASVAAVDISSENVRQQLRELTDAGAVGLRLRPEARSPGSDPYLIWRAAAECGLVVSCVGTAANFVSTAFAELASTFAGLDIIMEHLGGWARPDCDGAAATRSGIGELARFPNLYLKVPGLGQLVKRDAQLPPGGRALSLEPAAIVLEMIERFGAERMMWGSDFPPAASREGYANTLSWTRELLASTSLRTQELIFGDTARKVFRI
jgi:L-fuconolactonase